LDAREGDFDGLLTGTDFCTAMPAAGACSRCFLLGLWSLSPYEGGVSINGTSLGASAVVVSITAGLGEFLGYAQPFCLRTDCELKRGVSDMRGNRHYVHLAIMVALSFISMYVLMYAMVNRFANVYSNLNQFYMAGLMTAPIVVIELALMRSVYDNKNANIFIIAVSVVALGAFFLGIRQQAAIGDKSFLTSMIPHHAGAILMCERAPIQDAEIKKLCSEIISNQQREIDQMKSMLARLI
jgi:hypothetical protein